ncbi:MAG TPA: branched-chain amino acid ABC transporter substrate-binding protein, partial [Clostridiaceae bacterium]|nr:branched-chain amino acid ABC transporter substrate-binding protein [Clostridiaceae bacterium]
EFLQLGGSAVEGAVFSTFFAKDKPLNSESEKFLKEFDAEYKGKEPSAVSALGYDAYRVILDAIKRAGSADSVKIRDELAKTKDFVGAAGNITFDEDRNAIKNAGIKKVEGGKFKYMTTIEPENN